MASTHTTAGASYLPDAPENGGAHPSGLAGSDFVQKT
jgi:hypothetical protein